MGIATDCIHAGQEPEEVTGAVTVPIFQTSTYVQPELGRHKGFEYARTQNPTRFALERNLAALEKGKHGHCFASGMAAIDCTMRLLSGGDHVIAGENMYGGSFRLFDKVLRRFGLEFTYVDTSNVDAVRAAVKPNTKMLYLETPTNPMMTISDIAACVDAVKGRGILTVVDNTFMSPYFQRPIEMGADVVVHSTTKYLNGHSDSVGGVVVTTTDELGQKIGFLQNAAGAILSPFDSFLVTRGVKTLAVRMRQHDENGREIAAWLAKQPKIVKVYYPGLPEHPQHELAKRQMSGFGGMIAFELGSYEKAKAFLDKVRLCSLGESLGGVETLISHPVSMTHGSVPQETREKLGITPGLVRISVGIEDVDDLKADLSNAIAAL
ncbi:MAG: PLP-dependent aspartate aminotransferase family protein [Thermoanaerobaculia bacterium]|jgi:cystathionine gamma-lyase/cystathionine beta-lyase/cystathionine gamma-lyase/homocysteine desulfhydrase